MAQDIGTMRIRVEADTRDAEQGLKRTTSELSKMQMEAARAQRNAARAATAQAFGALAIASLPVAYQIARMRNQSAVDNATRMATRYGARQAAKVAGMSLPGGLGMAGRLGSGILGMVGILGGVLLVMKGVHEVVKTALDETKKQTQLMGDIQRAASEANRTREYIQSRGFEERDPYRRGLIYNRERLRELGAVSTPLQGMRYGVLADLERELEAMREQRERNVGMVAGPYRDLWLRMNKVAVGVQNWIGRQATEPTGLGMTARGLAASNPFVGGATMLDTVLRFGFPGSAEGAIAGELERASAMQRREELLRLQTRGPGAVLSAAPTIRAGTEGDYRLRVQMQTQDLAIRQTMKWQDEVLKILMAMAGRGEIEAEEVRRTEIRFGRRPTPLGEILEGVD